MENKEKQKMEIKRHTADELNEISALCVKKNCGWEGKTSKDVIEFLDWKGRTMTFQDIDLQIMKTPFPDSVTPLRGIFTTQDGETKYNAVARPGTFRLRR